VGIRRGRGRARECVAAPALRARLAYWTDGKEERIVYVTIGYALVALDAKTGRPVPGFGTDGTVDLQATMTSRRSIP